MNKQLKFVCIACSIFLLIELSECFNVQTETSMGSIRGNKIRLDPIGIDIEVYLGIPYARPPVDNLRFKDPIPLPKLKSKIYGLEIFPSSCPQEVVDMSLDFRGLDNWMLNSKIDEDCLFLNIWKPTHAPTNLPVIVWIHGGGMIYGGTSIPMYNGSYLAAWTNVVVVTIQYRLGAFGFLYTGDDFAPGNAGLKDQVLALKWVNEHIHNFGGDKDSITVIGESAGGASVGLHVLSQSTSLLFKRAILLSGTPNNEYSVLDPSIAKEGFYALGAKLGANKSNINEVKCRLLNISWEAIIKEQTNILSEKFFSNAFATTIEPILIPEHPHVMLRKASHLKGKEMIAGWTKDEGSMFVLFELIFLKKILHITDIPIINKEYLFERFKYFINTNKLEELVKIYNENNDNPNLEGLVNYYSDLFMRCSINQFIGLSRDHDATVYHFEYDHRSLKTAWPEWMGIVHGTDLELLFGLALHDVTNFNLNDKNLCLKYLDYIQNFVRTGNPNTANNEETWHKNEMYIFSHEQKNVDNRSETCAKLKNIIPQFLSRNEASKFLNDSYLEFM